MANYMFHCGACSTFRETVASIQTGPGELECRVCGNPMTRAYAAEKAGFVGLHDMKISREVGGMSNHARLMLPTNDDFKGPEDPDGKKGMRQWREDHPPRESNKKPHWPGEVEKKVFSMGGI